MDDFVATDWLPVLRAHGLADFHALWQVQIDWFEPPNRDRGGWSGVVRLELPGPDGAPRGLFLKRQQNHTRRSPRHPLRREPTATAEFRNMLMMRAAGVPVLEPVWFAQRRVDGNWCAVLMTRELVGYRPLDAWADDWVKQGWARSRALRRRVIDEIAPLLRRMHLSGYVHNAMQPKHLFLWIDGTSRVDVRVIDLEKMRRRFLVFRTALRDLDSLNRRSRYWSTTDRLRFLKRYLGCRRLGWRGQLLWRLLARRYAAAMRPRGADHG